jgi:peptidyl-dipeptidase A
LFSIFSIAIVVAAALSLNAHARPADEARARKFIAEHEARVRPLEQAVNLAWWTASVSGKDADFKAKEQAQNKLDEVLADKERFAADFQRK